ncbi:hypothetical protein QFC21_007217 [Naganishia friedmannii]|uniref:Uncharacterized protein n=1 Tax=Naganishia friedmannii TaxID=89922 RepID=A0ACC2UYJ8_9TREE|nr:hypothetical protein QFC21_007217 [Naganishia friedmannii]
MGKFFARLAGGGKKKDARNTPPAAPAPPTAPSRVPSRVPSNPNTRSPISSPISTRPPQIDLDFGTSSLPIANVSPAKYPATSTPATSSRNGKVGDDQEGSEVMAAEDAVRLAAEQFDWRQVEHACFVAGKQLLTIGLETPHLFDHTHAIAPHTRDQIDRLLALLLISTSPNPLSILPSLSSLSDLYPAPEFIPTTPGWFENDFTTHVQAVKDPRVIAGFLRRVTSQLRGVDSDAGDARNQKEPDEHRKTVRLSTWYADFDNSNQSSGHPQDAYTTLLSSFISKQQHAALSAIFENWLRIDDSSRFNSSSARFLAGLTGWWIMACQARIMADIQAGFMQWEAFYGSWVEAADAVYRLFLSWIRNQPTSTLPLRALEHVQSYPALPSDNGTETETDVLVCNVTHSLPLNSIQTTAQDILPGSPREMVVFLLNALDRDDGSGKKVGGEGEEISDWLRSATPAAVGSPDSGKEGTTTLRQILQAIKDARLSSPAVSSSRDPNGIHTPPATGSTEGKPIYRPFRTPSSSSFMQGIDTPERSASVGVNTPYSIRNTSALGFPPESPHALSPSPVAGGITEPDPSWMDFAQSGFDGSGSNLPEKPFLLGEAFKEAPQMAKASPPIQKSGLQTALALGIGRPGQCAARKSGPTGTYTFKSVSVARLRSSFFEFEKDARRLPRGTEGWPLFMVITLNDSVVQRFGLRSKFLLVLVDIMEARKPEAPPAPIEKDHDNRVRSVSSPLQTRPLPLQVAPPGYTSPPAPAGYTSPPADDSEKRNRRRSFFRSFSGGSNKNRRSISSPLSSPALPNTRMAESPLPPVVEKREPVRPSPNLKESPLPAAPSAVPSPPRNLLEPYRPLHSRSTSSVHRKPAPILDPNELRDLERSESRTRTSTDMRDADNKAATPVATVVISEDNVEIIRTDSLGSSSSTKNDSDSPKSLPRRRRSMAPSPASVGDGQVKDDASPTDALNKLALDDEVEEESGTKDGDATATVRDHPSSNAPALIVGSDITNGAVPEMTVPGNESDGNDVENTILQAPVMLGAVL